MTWKHLETIDLEILKTTREALHQVVQMVSAVPRNLLPHDPSDSSASLEWNNPLKGLQAKPILTDTDEAILVGLQFEAFRLYIANHNEVISNMEMQGKTVLEGLQWLKDTLAQLGLNSDQITLDLPYKIKAYDYSQPVTTEPSALLEFSNLFYNTQDILSKITSQYEKASEIRCWPHHFDIATLITVKTDEKEATSSSIGVGLSPGDEAIQEPYVYVNAWPFIELRKLQTHPLPNGYWNKKGWSGGVLTYSALSSKRNQEQVYVDFVHEVISTLLDEMKYR